MVFRNYYNTSPVDKMAEHFLKAKIAGSLVVLSNEVVGGIGWAGLVSCSWSSGRSLTSKGTGETEGRGEGDTRSEIMTLTVTFSKEAKQEMSQ